MTLIADQFTLEAPQRFVPRVKTGYFYIQDRQYYLYDRKATALLWDLTWTRFTLSQVLIPGTEKIRISGVELPEDAYVLRGNLLEIRHVDPYEHATLWMDLIWDQSRWDAYKVGFTFLPDDEVTVEGNFYQWADNSFVEGSTIAFHRFGEGETFYRFSRIPTPGYPVVITDDSIETTDIRNQSVEFRVDYETGILTFNAAKNLITNHDFSLEEADGFPAYWTPSRAVSSIGLVDTPTPAVGTKCLKIGAYAGGPDYVEQTIPANRDVYTLSAHLLTAAVGVSIDIFFLKSDYSSLGTFSVTLDGTSEWLQAIVSFAAEGYASDVWTDVLKVIPAGTEFIRIRLFGDTTQEVFWDAVQLERNPFATDYVNISPLSTVEFETGEGIFHTSHPLKTYDADGRLALNDFPVERVDANPFVHGSNKGFLFLYEYDQITDRQLGKGGREISLPTVGGALLGNPDFEATTIPNQADGWTPMVGGWGVNTTVDPDAQSGSNAIKVQGNGADISPGVDQLIEGEDQGAYFLSLFVKGSLLTDLVVRLWNGTPFEILRIPSADLPSDYTQFEILFELPAGFFAVGSTRFQVLTDGTPGVDNFFFVDNIEYKAVAKVSVVQGRTHLPYAKTHGLGKLTQRQHFHLANLPYTQDAPVVGTIPRVDTLKLIPPFGSTVQLAFAWPKLRLRVGQSVDLFAFLAGDNEMGMSGELISVSAPSGADRVSLSTGFPTNADGATKFQMEGISTGPAGYVLVSHINLAPSEADHRLDFEVVA